MKAGSASSASSFDVEALAKMMASEYVMTSDPYNVEKKAGVGTQSCGGGNLTYEEPSKLLFTFSNEEKLSLGNATPPQKESGDQMRWIG
ncbi:hypothetical protein Tco_0869355 [Tanacetum coccineum]